MAPRAPRPRVVTIKPEDDRAFHHVSASPVGSYGGEEREWSIPATVQERSADFDPANTTSVRTLRHRITHSGSLIIQAVVPTASSVTSDNVTADSPTGLVRHVRARIGCLKRYACTATSAAACYLAKFLSCSIYFVLWLIKHYVLNVLSGILTCAVSLLVVQMLCQYDICVYDAFPALRPPSAQSSPLRGHRLAPVTREEMEERLLRASHDDVGYRDFASYAAGARPIEGLTSRTWDGPGTLSSSEPQDILRGKQVRGPAWALKRDIQQGSCWHMAGTAGYLGIQLAEPVIVTNVTVDHLPASLASETRSAPYHIRVWALVPTSYFTAFWAASTPTSRVGTVLDPPNNDAPRDISPMLRGAVPSGAQLVHIADVEYDIRSAQHIQTFPASDNAPITSVDKVVFQVLDNWGFPEFTCIYRVRVHGTAAE